MFSELWTRFTTEPSVIGKYIVLVGITKKFKRVSFRRVLVLMSWPQKKMQKGQRKPKARAVQEVPSSEGDRRGAPSLSQRTEEMKLLWKVTLVIQSFLPMNVSH